MIDVVILDDSIVRKKHHETIENSLGLREQPEKMWKKKVVPGVIGALRAVTPKCRTFKLPGLWQRKSHTIPSLGECMVFIYFEFNQFVLYKTLIILSQIL